MTTLGHQKFVALVRLIVISEGCGFCILQRSLALVYPIKSSAKYLCRAQLKHYFALMKVVIMVSFLS